MKCKDAISVNNVRVVCSVTKLVKGGEQSSAEQNCINKTQHKHEDCDHVNFKCSLCGAKVGFTKKCAKCHAKIQCKWQCGVLNVVPRFKINDGIKI